MNNARSVLAEFGTALKEEAKQVDLYESHVTSGVIGHVAEVALRVAHIIEPEPPRTTVCAWCQKERGEQPQPGQSHGLCRYHLWSESQKIPNVALLGRTTIHTPEGITTNQEITNGS